MSSSKRIAAEVQDEFARQAKPMAGAAAFHAGPVLRWFAEALGSEPRAAVLDLACGPGIVAQAVAPHVGHIVGIDATPEIIRLANQGFELNRLTNGLFSVASAEELPFENGEFDQAVTRLAFHHFPDVTAVLSEVRRVLHPGGRLLVADVASSDDPTRSALHNSLEKLRDPTHIRMYPAADLLQLIEGAGFTILQRQSWDLERSFTEWAAIISSPARTEPLRAVMQALVRGGEDAGISLRDESGEIRFTHTWILISAKAD